LFDQRRDELYPIFQLWDLSKTSEATVIEKAFRDYCRGKSDPRFEKQTNFPDETIFNKNDLLNHAERNFALFAYAILGEFGSSIYLSMMDIIKVEVEKEVYTLL
jgi:hypothetical protein